MDSEDGELFVKHLATFVRTHEKALANALQFRKQPTARYKSSQSVSSISIPQSPRITERPSTSASNASTGLAAALSLGPLSLTSSSVKTATLGLTPHHLFYLLSKIEDLDIPVGPMKVRLENLHDTSSAANYVSFLSQSHRSNSRSSDSVSIRSVSSMRSVMSGMSSLWSNFGLGGNSIAKQERQRLAVEADLKYLYSAFTKIPALKLAPDWRARLIRGYEEFPFDSAVPLYVFKNVQSLEVRDIDYRQFFGWDRMADNLRTLVLKRAHVNQHADILIDIVLDDMDGRRRRTTKKDNQAQSSPTTPWPASSSPRSGSPPIFHPDISRSVSVAGSPAARSSAGDVAVGSVTTGETSVQHSRRPSITPVPVEARSPPKSSRPRSHSPSRPGGSRHTSAHGRSSHKVKRSGSGSSHSSLSDSWHHRGSSSNLLAMGILPTSKWRFLKHLGLPENGLVDLPAHGFTPLVNTLLSLDLSGNQFNSIPDSLATLTALRSLNLSHNVINDLRTLKHSPLPAITALNLRANRLADIAGIETLYPLERLDLRENQIHDPTELQRLTGIPDLREIYVEGNPFTRTHRDYRVTLFNLFRSTPGYTEDIIIDGTGPSYSEKKRLVERAPIPPAVPVIKPSPAPMPAVDVSKPAIVYGNPREPAVLRKERPTPKTTTSEVHTTSSRKRRAPKRRIVDISTPETTAKLVSQQPLVSNEVVKSADQAPSKKDSTDDYYRVSKFPETAAPLPAMQHERVATASAATEGTPRATSRTPQLPPLFPDSQQPSWPNPQQWEIDAEMYRRKIESLRDQVGTGYLSVLSEENWEQPRNTIKNPDFNPPPMIPSPAPCLATTQPIHSGRTLG
ncbi:leucine Rich Repeat domain-containing protein [Zalerion maritima]|uniref:Leucine Rich Repeat domain-containing protein n=1 Tax=Zalerion maritima TaxID=339359 RepID=A0AAD5RNS2_9PEZI|nr:leucine Rich Repeat domain-containing protein [Zalerion maritima]